MPSEMQSYMERRQSKLTKRRATRARNMLVRAGLTVTSEQKQLVAQEVVKYVDLSRHLWPECADLQPLDVKFEVTGVTAGKARFGSHAVDFNAALLVKNWDQFITRTVPHEVAHIVTNHVYRVKRLINVEAHGPEWKQVMRRLGVPEDEVTRCHTYDVSGVARRKSTTVDYHCHCGTHFAVGAKRHAKIQDGGVMWCKRCKGVIVPVGTAAPTSEESAQRISRLKQVHQAMVQNTPHQITAALRQIGINVDPSTLITPSKPPGGTAFSSKFAQAKAIYRFSKGKSRSDVIAIFVRDVGLTAAGAATYYYNCQKVYGPL